MAVFENKKIESIQEWKGNKLKFDPDASPAAWEHYKLFYSNIFSEYSIGSPNFFSWKGNGCYILEPNGKEKKYERLYALVKSAVPKAKDDKCYGAVLRLSGEVDFNFNEVHIGIFKNLLSNNTKYLEKLKKCAELHHTLVNFSLMQTMGQMQVFKGNKCDDRLDRFIYYLGKFYDTPKNKRGETDIAKYATSTNRKFLIGYLNQFVCLTDYCHKVYYINDEKFIQDLRNHGEIKRLVEEKHVKDYIDLACRFWEQKSFNLSNAFIQ